MAKNPDAYVDTSAFIAFLDRSDTYHPLFHQLFSDPPTLITTALVIAEAQAWFLRRYDKSKALQFMAVVEDMTPLKLLAVGKQEQTGATALLRKFSDQDLTLTDAVGLYMMQVNKLKRCWSTDFHLRLTGATLAIDQ